MSFAAVYYSVLEVKLTVLCIHRDIDWKDRDRRVKFLNF